MRCCTLQLQRINRQEVGGCLLEVTPTEKEGDLRQDWERTGDMLIEMGLLVD